MNAFVAEIFFEVPGDLCRGFERRQDVHETKKLGFEILVAHRPFHQGGIKALAAEKGGRFGRVHQIEDFDTPLLNFGFEVAIG